MIFHSEGVGTLVLAGRKCCASQISRRTGISSAVNLDESKEKVAFFDAALVALPPAAQSFTAGGGGRWASVMRSSRMRCTGQDEK